MTILNLIILQFVAFIPNVVDFATPGSFAHFSSFTWKLCLYRFVYSAEKCVLLHAKSNKR